MNARHTARLLGLSLLTLPGLWGCSQPHPGPIPITEVRPATDEERDVSAAASTADRLGLRSASESAGAPMAANAPAGAGGGALDHPFAWDAPESWVALPSSPMRLANYQVGTDGECYFTVLGGDGGGLAANINRWRGQMNLQPQTDDEIAALPAVTLLQQDAKLVTLDGAYSGMGGGTGASDYRMLGAALIFMDRAFFVKMTGPIAQIEPETANFVRFCESIRLAGPDEVHDEHDGHDHSADDGHDHGDASGADSPMTGNELPPGHPEIASGSGAVTSLPPAAAAQGGFDASSLMWTAPENWERAPDRMMRAVTYMVEGAECYVSVLPGSAGGVEANINRWVGQMGQPPLTPGAISALPAINVLGNAAPVVTVEGDFTGMSGETQTNQKLLGTIASVDGQSVFIKMTGPAAVVDAQHDQFVQFCESLQRGA